MRSTGGGGRRERNRVSTLAHEQDERDERESLDERYGARRAPAAKRIERWGAVVGAVLLVAVIAFWGVGTLLQGAAATISTTVVNFSVPDDATITVDYSLTVQPGTALVCALEAQNAQHLVVGWLEQHVPAGTDSTRTVSATVRTTQPASSILVNRCWIP